MLILGYAYMCIYLYSDMLIFTHAYIPICLCIAMLIFRYAHLLIFVHAHVPLARILLRARAGTRALMLVSPQCGTRQATRVPAVVTIELAENTCALAGGVGYFSHRNTSEIRHGARHPYPRPR